LKSVLAVAHSPESTSWAVSLWGLTVPELIPGPPVTVKAVKALQSPTPTCCWDDSTPTILPVDICLLIPKLRTMLCIRL
jgi:hypothetical protein